jgi:DNA-binding HxlR family transcriptional regulator
MAEEGISSWQDDLTGRERVRAVVETLDGGATVQAIADRAEVSPTTASDELERLESENRVRKTLVDDKKGYELNPTRMFFEELMDLIEGHSRDELEAELEQLKSEQESLCDEFGVDSLVLLRERLVEEELSAEETREIRNAASTWEALNTELTLVRHALRLYDDVAELDGSTGSPAATV